MRRKSENIFYSTHVNVEWFSFREVLGSSSEIEKIFIAFISIAYISSFFTGKKPIWALPFFNQAAFLMSYVGYQMETFYWNCLIMRHNLIYFGQSLLLKLCPTNYNLN